MNKNRHVTLTEEENQVLKDNWMKPTHLLKEAIAILKKHNKSPQMHIENLDLEIEFLNAEIARLKKL